MNCREFQDWLSDVERSRPVREGWAHVEQCGDAGCRSQWEECLAVDEAIAAWKGSVPEVNVIDRVWSVVSQPAATSQRREAARHATSSRGAWSVLVLSCSLVALSMWGLSVLNRQHRNAGPAVVAESPQPDPEQELTSEPPLQKYSLASVSLAQSASAFVADAALLTVQDVGDPDDPSRPVSRFATKVSRQLQPLEENLNSALEFIDKVIPDMSMMQMVPTS
jgi:hypothetical protein